MIKHILIALIMLTASVLACAAAHHLTGSDFFSGLVGGVFLGGFAVIFAMGCLLDEKI